MAATQDEFLYTVREQGVPNDALYLFAITGSGVTLIPGIALSVFSKPSETSTVSENISEVLEQVERLYFEFPAGQPIIVNVTDRGEYADEDGRYFYYLQITPITIGTELDQTEVQNVRINFYPYIKGQTFYNSEYNATQNNVNDQRRSTLLQISDRNSMSIEPSNLTAILNDFATKAEIPDSNYTSTGWVNARYDGVESTGREYGGIPSALTGTTFRGSYHSVSLPSASILALSSEDKVIKTYLHTGNELLPAFKVNRSQLKILGSPTITTESTQISYNQYPLNSSISVNSLLIITGSVGFEVVRVTDYDLTKKTIQVTRGVGDTSPKAFSTYKIYPIYENRVYELEGNKINSIDTGKVLLSSTNKIVKIDEFGVVYGEEN